MSRLRAIRLVAMREILERGRSRGYVLSLAFTVFILVGAFLLPILLAPDEDKVTLAIAGPAPAGLETALDTAASQSGLTLVLTTVPDRAAAEAALRAKSIDGALEVPADGSGPGSLVVLESANPRLQAIANAAVIGVRAGASVTLLEPPVVVALEPNRKSVV